MSPSDCAKCFPAAEPTLKKKKKKHGSGIAAFDSDSRETHGNWKRSGQNAWVVPKGRAIMPISEQL